MRFNWSYRAEFRTGAIDANGLADYRTDELLLDMSAEVRLSKRLAAYFSVRNLTNEPGAEIDRHGPSTPVYARIRSLYHTGAFMTVGLKGEF